MDQKALFLKFWDKEAAATRKVIERIPQERSDYRADPKARTARDIAWLLVREEMVLGDGLESEVGLAVCRAAANERTRTGGESRVDHIDVERNGKSARGT